MMRKNWIPHWIQFLNWMQRELKLIGKFFISDLGVRIITTHKLWLILRNMIVSYEPDHWKVTDCKTSHKTSQNMAHFLSFPLCIHNILSMQCHEEFMEDINHARPLKGSHFGGSCVLTNGLCWVSTIRQN